MNRPGLIGGTVAGLVAVGLLFPQSLWACAACFGRSDDAMAKGMNMGILALLVVVCFVLGGVGAFAIYLARRAARYSAPSAADPTPAAAAEPALAPLAEPVSQLSK